MKSYTCTLDQLSKWITMSVFIALLIPVITIANITFHQQTLAERLAFIFTFILLGTGLSLAYLWKPLQIELNNEFLIVKRKIGDKKFPLAAIQSAAVITKKELGFGIRIFGSGGFFGYYGLFKYKNIGSVNLYCTKREDLVLLTLTKGKILLSPDMHLEFLNDLDNIKKAPKQ